MYQSISMVCGIHEHDKAWVKYHGFAWHAFLHINKSQHTSFLKKNHEKYGRSPLPIEASYLVGRLKVKAGLFVWNKYF